MTMKVGALHLDFPAGIAGRVVSVDQAAGVAVVAGRGGVTWTVRLEPEAPLEAPPLELPLELPLEAPLEPRPAKAPKAGKVKAHDEGAKS